jgi:hypothetical protein
MPKLEEQTVRREIFVVSCGGRVDDCESGSNWRGTVTRLPELPEQPVLGRRWFSALEQVPQIIRAFLSGNSKN